MMAALSPKVQEAFDMWMSIPITDEYFAWCATVDLSGVAWKDMTDEQAVHTIELFKQYMAEYMGREDGQKTS